MNIPTGYQAFGRGTVMRLSVCHEDVLCCARCGALVRVGDEIYHDEFHRQLLLPGELKRIVTCQNCQASWTMGGSIHITVCPACQRSLLP